MRHRWRSFNFQYTASIVIFILVIIIILSGLFFSGWQFSFTLKQIKLKEEALRIAKDKIPATVPEQPVAQTDPPTPPVNLPTVTDNTLAPLDAAFKTDLDVTTTGIKANSSVLGVIILVLSIIFFNCTSCLFTLLITFQISQ